MRLDEAFEAIIDSITNMLIAACGGGGLLEGVRAVVRGDRARPRPDVPAVWVFAEMVNPEHNPTTIQESWSLPVVLAAIVKSEDPEEGYRMASSLAARARSVVLKERTLGLRQVVQDTRSGRFEPGGPWHREGNLYSAVAVLQVTFRIREGG
jgi:hypothetical protein